MLKIDLHYHLSFSKKQQITDKTQTTINSWMTSCVFFKMLKKRSASHKQFTSKFTYIKRYSSNLVILRAPFKNKPSKHILKKNRSKIVVSFEYVKPVKLTKFKIQHLKYKNFFKSVRVNKNGLSSVLHTVHVLKFYRGKKNKVNILWQNKLHKNLKNFTFLVNDLNDIGTRHASNRNYVSIHCFLNYILARTKHSVSIRPNKKTWCESNSPQQEFHRSVNCNKNELNFIFDLATSSLPSTAHLFRIKKFSTINHNFLHKIFV